MTKTQITISQANEIEKEISGMNGIGLSLAYAESLQFCQELGQKAEPNEEQCEYWSLRASLISAALREVLI